MVLFKIALCKRWLLLGLLIGLPLYGGDPKEQEESRELQQFLQREIHPGMTNQSILGPTDTCYKMIEQDPTIFNGLVALARCDVALQRSKERSYCGLCGHKSHETLKDKYKITDAYHLASEYLFLLNKCVSLDPAAGVLTFTGPLSQHAVRMDIVRLEEYDAPTAIGSLLYRGGGARDCIVTPAQLEIIRNNYKLLAPENTEKLRINKTEIPAADLIAAGSKFRDCLDVER